MLLAILQMSKDLAMGDELSRHQYWQAGRRAAHEILQARAEVEQLRAGWLPIESAPRDGTWILLWDHHREVAVSGCWHDEPERNSPNGYEPGWSWWSADDDLLVWDGDGPTYWMPLPQPPKECAP